MCMYYCLQFNCRWAHLLSQSFPTYSPTSDFEIQKSHLGSSCQLKLFFSFLKNLCWPSWDLLVSVGYSLIDSFPPGKSESQCFILFVSCNWSCMTWGSKVFSLVQFLLLLLNNLNFELYETDDKFKRKTT